MCVKLLKMAVFFKLIMEIKKKTCISYISTGKTVNDVVFLYVAFPNFLPG